jgi:hypothetical protein
LRPIEVLLGPIPEPDRVLDLVPGAFADLAVGEEEPVPGLRVRPRDHRAGADQRHLGRAAGTDDRVVDRAAAQLVQVRRQLGALLGGFQVVDHHLRVDGAGPAAVVQHLAQPRDVVEDAQARRGSLAALERGAERDSAHRCVSARRFFSFAFAQV